MSKKANKLYKTLEFAMGENESSNAFNDLKEVLTLIDVDLNNTFEFGQNMFFGTTLIIHDVDIDPYDVILNMLEKHPHLEIVLIIEDMDSVMYESWNLIPGQYTCGSLKEIIKNNLGDYSICRSVEEWKSEIETL